MKCRKNTESDNPQFARTENARTMLLSKYAVRDSNYQSSKFIKQRSKFIKQQELLSSLEIKTLLSKIPLVGALLF